MALEDLLSITVEEMLYQFFLPFLIIFIILWGILSNLDVFGRKINLILAFTLSLIVTSSDLFALLTQYMSQVTGYTALIAFAGVFVFGVTIWSIRKGADIYDESMSMSRKEKGVLKKLEKIDRKLSRARGAKRKRLLQERKILEDEQRIARARRRHR